MLGDSMDSLSRRTVVGIAAGGLVLARARFAWAAESTGPLRSDLMPLARFIGKWTGEGDGEPGHSTLERTYEPGSVQKVATMANERS